MNEIWKPCVGLENYEISNLGRVKGPKGIRKLTKANKTGHLKLTVTKQGKHRCILVHRLVADAFLGKQPEGTEILHKDDDPSNNAVSNLFYGTHAENIKMSVRHKQHFKTKRRHLTDDQVREIRNSDASTTELALRFGVHYNCVYNARNYIGYAD